MVEALKYELFIALKPVGNVLLAVAASVTAGLFPSRIPNKNNQKIVAKLRLCIVSVQKLHRGHFRTQKCPVPS